MPRRPNGVARLKDGMLVLAAVDRARDAALAFLHGANVGWGKADLAQWFAAHYTYATVAPSAGSSQWRRTVVPSRGPLSAQPIERLLIDTRTALVTFVTELAGATPSPALMNGLAVPAFDEHQGFGYVPVDNAEMSLFDRVAGLLVADFLTRSVDYERHLRCCESCGEVSFEWDEGHLGACVERELVEEHVSGTVARRRMAITPLSWAKSGGGGS